MSRKRLPVWRTLLVMLCDIVMIASGLMLAYWLRFHSELFELRGGYEPQAYLVALPWVTLAWFLALRLENLYRRRSRVLDFNVIRRIVTGSILAMLVILAIIFYRQEGLLFSRQLSVFTLATVVAMLIFGRCLLHGLFRWMLIQQGVGQSRVVVLGSGLVSLKLIENMLRLPEQGMRPAGLILSRPTSHPPRLPAGVPILGELKSGEQLEALLREHQVSEVILAEQEIGTDRLPELLTHCERAHVDFRIIPSATELLLSGMVVETFAGIPLLGLRETPLQGWNAAFKRGIDILASGTGLLLTSPLIGLFAWLVRRQDGHHPFFYQERMGIDGRRFKIIKLRSMPVDAEARSGPVFSDDYDARCTRLGGFLRRSHLDELPQLLNVLRGEMSLVGPRPERPYFVDQFRDDIPRYMARHKVKSGITGWAQVNGLCGKHGSINERLKYDLYYIENWTLWLDFKILLRTAFGLVRPGTANED